MGIEKLLEGIELPKWARWAAQDRNGEVWVFGGKPKLSVKRGCWDIGSGPLAVEPVMQAPIAINWRDTLTRLEAREQCSA